MNGAPAVSPEARAAMRSAAAAAGDPYAGFTLGAPQAEDFPRGTFVLSTDGTDRSSLRWSVFWLSVLVFSLGLGVGWFMWGRKERGR